MAYRVRCCSLAFSISCLTAKIVSVVPRFRRKPRSDCGCTVSVAKEKLWRKRFRKKHWISEETLDLIDERRNMKAHGKNVNNPEYKEKSRAIRRACRKDKERYTEDKCETIVGLCKQGRTSEMYKEIRTLIKKFTPL